jgi:hypothetical protein
MEYEQTRTAGNLAFAADPEPVIDTSPPTTRSATDSHPTLRVLPALPPAPDSVEDLGIPDTFIEDLLLKTLYRTQVPTPIGLSNQLPRPLSVTCWTG